MLHVPGKRNQILGGITPFISRLLACEGFLTRVLIWWHTPRAALDVLCQLLSPKVQESSHDSVKIQNCSIRETWL